MTLPAVGPENHQLTRADFLDLRRCARFHSTSRTGAS
jgi:hypothetical protein